MRKKNWHRIHRHSSSIIWLLSLPLSEDCLGLKTLSSRKGFLVMLLKSVALCTYWEPVPLPCASQKTIFPYLLNISVLNNIFLLHLFFFFPVMNYVCSFLSPLLIPHSLQGDSAEFLTFCPASHVGLFPYLTYRMSAICSSEQHSHFDSSFLSDTFFCFLKVTF